MSAVSELKRYCKRNRLSQPKYTYRKATYHHYECIVGLGHGVSFRTWEQHNTSKRQAQEKTAQAMLDMLKQSDKTP